MSLSMNKASIFMGASWVGLGALILAAGAAASAAPRALSVVGILALVASSILMLATRRADEYTQGLWNAGASVAFGTMLINFLGLAFAEGFFDGATGAEHRQDIPAVVVPVLAIAAFYIGMFIKRLMGDQ